MTEQFLIRFGKAEDVPAVLDIWREAYGFMVSINALLWTPDMFDSAAAERHVAAGELVIGFDGKGAPSACMLLQKSDPFFWPDRPEGSALYIHRVAVRRAEAGRGWPGRLLTWAAIQGRGLPLRLDCAPRPKLMAVYESIGFVRVDDGPVTRGPFTVMRYERV